MTERSHASAPVQAIPGIPVGTSARLLETLGTCPAVTAIWLFGSRAMGRHHTGSDLDLCLEGPALEHTDRLRLMTAIEELLLPWQVDLALKRELPPDLQAHIDRVGQCLWRRGD
jgi:predicted nucleotidyltransferase